MSTARRALTAPEPAVRTLYGLMSAAAAEAVPTIAALTASGFHDGLAAWTRAATPAMCGEAIEVPERVVPLLPLPTRVDTIELPGAVTSGFAALSPLRGPPELNVASCL